MPPLTRTHGLIAGGVALLAIVGGALYACDSTEPLQQQQAEARTEQTLARRLKAACASEATYDRLKQVAFDEAIRIRNADPENLDLLSTHSLVRVENPVVKSRDDTLDVTVCTGRFILEVPPGAERAFEGRRRLIADIEYAAQAAADGSGMVYQIKGAEPIIYSLATFDLKAQAYRPRTEADLPAVAAAPQPVETPEQVAVAPEPVRPAPAPTAAPSPPRPAPVRTAEPAAPRPVQAAAAPSFNCRVGRSRSEQMVCNNGQLASLDREMSSQFYSALSRGDERVRSALRQSRDRFLSYRERCGDEACVEQAYRDRMNEIADIAGR